MKFFIMNNIIQEYPNVYKLIRMHNSSIHIYTIVYSYQSNTLLTMVAANSLIKRYDSFVELIGFRLLEFAFGFRTFFLTLSLVGGYSLSFLSNMAAIILF